MRALHREGEGHPNVLGLVDYAVDPDTHYIVMELAPGKQRSSLDSCDKQLQVETSLVRSSCAMR